MSEPVKVELRDKMLDARIAEGARERVLSAHGALRGSAMPPERFEPGQLSGPHGPQFVGHARLKGPPLWRSLAEHLAFGLGVGAAVAAAMALIHVA